MASRHNLIPIFNEYNRVLMLPEFQNDEPRLINGKGEYERYARALMRKTKYVHKNIDNHGGRVRKEWLETMRYKGSSNLFKIPIGGSGKNYRIILCFIYIDDIEHAIYLHSFREKKQRKDYEKAITEAGKRYNNIKDIIK